MSSWNKLLRDLTARLYAQRLIWTIFGESTISAGLMSVKVAQLNPFNFRLHGAERSVCSLLDSRVVVVRIPGLTGLIAKQSCYFLKEYYSHPRCSKCDRPWHSFKPIITSLRRTDVRRIAMMNCPRCTSVRIHQSRRRGIIETMLLAMVCFRPFRCERCDARFFRFSFAAKTNSPRQAAMY